MQGPIIGSAANCWRVHRAPQPCLSRDMGLTVTEEEHRARAHDIGERSADGGLGIGHLDVVKWPIGGPAFCRRGACCVGGC
eukprot:364582-Chlamydomonas_euryale.AAC.7